LPRAREEERDASSTEDGPTLEVVAGEEAGGLRTGRQDAADQVAPRLQEEEVARLRLVQLARVLHVEAHAKLQVELAFGTCAGQPDKENTNIF